MFVVIEGVNCSGKTTLWNNLHKILHSSDYVFLSESNSTPMAQGVRVLMKKCPSILMTTAFLYSASRTMLVPQIRNALQEGKTVIMDRWTPSMMVYHTELLSSSASALYQCGLIHNLCDLSSGNLVADLLILLSISGEEAVRRRDTSRQSIHSADIEYLNAQYVAYVERYHQYRPTYQIATDIISPDDLAIDVARTIRKHRQDMVLPRPRTLTSPPALWETNTLSRL